MAYASTTQFDQLGLPTAALSNLDAPTKQVLLDGFAGTMDEFIEMGGRYSTPLAAYGMGVVRANVHGATWDALCRRGFNPESPADQAVKARYDEIMVWLRETVAVGGPIAGAIDATPGTTENAPVGFGEAARGWNGADTTGRSLP